MESHYHRRVNLLDFREHKIDDVGFEANRMGSMKTPNSKRQIAWGMPAPIRSSEIMETVEVKIRI